LLAAGNKVGSYEVTGVLGAGGMGEVYRARDTRLGREVALKVLPEAFAQDAERLARLRREAQVLASLNHPNIAAIYGFEDSAGTLALVMELVEGPTLAERIAGGRTANAKSSTAQTELKSSTAREARKGAISLDDVLSIAKQIAEGLEYAHERGVVHRDLKPANVKITPDGAVKILDFGLAKALEGDPASVDISSSPTISRMATQAGIILGTAAYMSPEQAKGKSVDRRTDIWAFGCVLYEMLAGKSAFGGETVTDTLAAVIRGEPDWSALPKDTPTHVRVLLQRCLQKDAKQRLRDIGDARIAIEEVLSGAAATVEGQAFAVKAPQRAGRSWLPWAVAALCAIVAAIFATAYFLRAPQPANSAPIQLSLNIPPSQPLVTDNGPAVTLSPDGTRIAYVIHTDHNHIYVRNLDGSEGTPLQGAQGATPFFSPDGRWIAFYGTDGKLEKVSVFGGAPVTICDAGAARGGSWGKDGTIVFTQSYTTPLYRVSADGGTPVAVTHLDKSRNEVTHRWPQILPGGKDVLFTASQNNNDFGHADVEAASLATGQAKVLVENAYFGRYLASGYLTYVSGGTLFAAPFDAGKLKLTGTAMPVLTNLQADLASGSAQISFARTGTAVYIAGATLTNQLTVGLFDRKGHATPLVKEPGSYLNERFSPDGKRLALEVGSNSISVYDIARGTMTPITFASSGCIAPVWTADGKMITCTRTTKGLGISWLPSDGTGRMTSLTSGNGGAFQYASSWSPDGRTLAFYEFSPKTGGCCEIGTLAVSSSGQPGEPKILFGQGGVNGYSYPEISPDGRWMAYDSGESGSPQVYVVPFSGAGGKWQVSVTSGLFPRWSKAGHELFFVGENNVSTSAATLVAAPYTVNGYSFQPGQPEVLFQGGFEMTYPSPNYDVAPDGKHFAMLVPAGGNPSSSAAMPTVVINWFSRVAQMVAAGQK
jgi:eukaryotic-like serine/threonine-protein kinase